MYYHAVFVTRGCYVVYFHDKFSFNKATACLLTRKAIDPLVFVSRFGDVTFATTSVVTFTNCSAIATKFNWSTFSSFFFYFWKCSCRLSLLLLIVLLLPRFFQKLDHLFHWAAFRRVARGSSYMSGLICVFWIITFQTNLIKHFFIVTFLCFYFYL